VRDFLIADGEATRAITVRQLLNHTSGMAGDFFPDDQGAEGNLIARYVDRCNLLPLVHPVGELYSYSNSAFVVAGRLVEIVRGMSWYQAMEEYIYQPLGMTHAIADPKDMLRFSAAAGHVFDGEDTERWKLPDRAYLTMGMAPAGSTPAMRAVDLIAFARAHLQDGVNARGERWLSGASVRAMQTPQIALPTLSPLFDKHAGLGWGLTRYKEADNHKEADHYKCAGTRLISHGGATVGYLSMLVAAPGHDAAFAVLLNGFRPAALSAVTSDLLKAVIGIDDQEPEPPAGAVGLDALERFAGRYESMDASIEVTVRSEGLVARFVYKIDPLPPLELRLKPITDGCFAAYTLAGERQRNLAFVCRGTGGAMYLFNGRLNAKVA
jgi:CubicO group peptidase (beta-lactamase class C family)